MVKNNTNYNMDDEIVCEINESPIKWCSVLLSDVIERGKRLEASAYDVQGKAAIKIITSCKYGFDNLLSKDGLVKEAHHAPRFKRNYVEKDTPNSIGFLGSSEMLDIKPCASKFITKELADKLNLFVKAETVLMSCSGTIGKVSFVSSSLTPFAFSQHIIRLVCSNYSGYIYACILNPLVQKQIQSLVYGAVIQEIEPEHLKRVVIPNAPVQTKEKIHNLITKSYKLRDESNDLIDKATRLLIDELKFPPISEMDESYLKSGSSVKTFNVKLSRMDSRIDASYHLPIVDEIIMHMEKYAEEVTTIGDSRLSNDVVLPGRFKRVYVDEEYGVKFLGGKEMNQLDPTTEKYLSKKTHKKQLEGTLGIKENSILTPARGSLGEVVMPPKHFIGWAISDNMMQINSFENVYGYLYVFLNTEYGKALIQRHTYGGVVDAIETEHIKNVEIPILKSKNTQKKINDLALEANHKRYNAYLLEKEALKVLDEEVIYAK